MSAAAAGAGGEAVGAPLMPVGKELERLVQLLVDVRTFAANKNAVKGQVSAIIVQPRSSEPDTVWDVLAWGHNRSLVSDFPRPKAAVKGGNTGGHPPPKRQRVEEGAAAPGGVEAAASGGVRGVEAAVATAEPTADTVAPLPKPKVKLKQYKTDVHAEVDAVAMAAMNGVAVGGATILVTAICCNNCMATVTAAGLACVAYPVPPPAALKNSKNKELSAIHGVHLVEDMDIPGYAPIDVEATLAKLPAGKRVVPPPPKKE